MMKISIKVRDYECDIQGIVNNSVYMNYLEHARHEYIKEQLNINFTEMAQKGINLVLIHSEMTFKLPLKSGDHAVVESVLKRESKMKWVFYQEIRDKETKKVSVSSKAITTCISSEGKPIRPPELLSKMLVEK